MKLGMNHYYLLIEDNLISKDILYKLSRRTKNLELKNFFFERAQARDIFSEELKQALNYGFRIENSKSKLAKVLFTKKYRSSLSRTFINRKESNLLETYKALLIEDISKYDFLLSKTKEKSNLYPILNAQNNSLRQILEQRLQDAVHNELVA